MPVKKCKKYGCNNLTLAKYCEEHKELDKKYNDNRANSNKRGYTYKWQKYSKYFLNSNPLCVHCQKRGILTLAKVVDHIKPHKGNYQLFWDEKNHQPLCIPCHNRKTATEDMASWDTHKGLN